MHIHFFPHHVNVQIIIITILENTSLHIVLGTIYQYTDIVEINIFDDEQLLGHHIIFFITAPRITYFMPKCHVLF